MVVKVIRVIKKVSGGYAQIPGIPGVASVAGVAQVAGAAEPGEGELAGRQEGREGAAAAAVQEHPRQGAVPGERPARPGQAQCQVVRGAPHSQRGNIVYITYCIQLPYTRRKTLFIIYVRVILAIFDSSFSLITYDFMSFLKGISCR